MLLCASLATGLHGSAVPSHVSARTGGVRLIASPSPYDDGLFAVAPMMDYTDRFLRYLLRRLSVRQTLYTEMVTANTIVHCSESELPRFLEHDGDREQPVVLQLGGADPEMLRKASSIAIPWGYTALNLNVGCPSDRVAGSGCFGAALMREPELVADCCAAMSEGAGGDVPITVKCRIGLTDDKEKAATADDEADYAALTEFVETVSTRGGVKHFTVHARNAVLGGLSPAQNRQIPPLRYHLVTRLAQDFPELRFSLNGGIETIEDAKSALWPSLDERSPLSGVMVGRAVVARPWDFATLDTDLYGEAANPATSRRQVLDEFCAFAAEYEAEVPQRIRRLLLAPALNLFAGEPHGKSFRREIDTMAQADRHANRQRPAAEMLLAAANKVLLDETLDAPPGWRWDHHKRCYLPPEEAAAERKEKAKASA